MTDNSENPILENKEQETGVDLSMLSELTFGPSWTSERQKSFKNYDHFQDSDSNNRSSRGFKRNEGNRFGRNSHPQNRNGENRERNANFKRTPQDRNNPRGQRRPFHQDTFIPTVSVDIYPEDEPFNALTKAIRFSCKTYELFELAHLILAKPDRFVTLVKPIHKEGETKYLYYSPADHIPFESEEECLNHSLLKMVDVLFEKEEIEVEGPKGSFPIINRCTITGELISPPNYHRYQDLLRQHHQRSFSNMPFDRYLSKIESVKDPELVTQWIDQMKKVTKYTLKESKETDNPVTFTTWEAVRSYLLTNRRKDLVRAKDSVRLRGTQLDAVPRGNIRRAIEKALEEQKRFPLITANNLRSRLRRMHFAIYKRGSKGHSYVCAVKRKFRIEGQKLADNVQGLIEFIEKHPKIKVTELPYSFLGLQQPQEVKPAEKSTATDAASTENTPSTEAHTIEHPSVTPEDQARVKDVLLNLRWLVSEGYVTEYGDNTLFAPSPIPEAKAKELHAEDNQHHADEHHDVDTTHQHAEENTPSTEEKAAE